MKNRQNYFTFSFQASMSTAVDEYNNGWDGGKSGRSEWLISKSPTLHLVLGCWYWLFPNMLPVASRT